MGCNQRIYFIHVALGHFCVSLRLPGEERAPGIFLPPMMQTRLVGCSNVSMSCGSQDRKKVGSGGETRSEIYGARSYSMESSRLLSLCVKLVRDLPAIDNTSKNFQDMSYEAEVNFSKCPLMMDKFWSIMLMSFSIKRINGITKSSSYIEAIKEGMWPKLQERVL